MVYVSAVAVAFAISMGVAFSAIIRLLRSQLRDSRRREDDLLNRLMFMADKDRPWVEAPSQGSAAAEVAQPEGDVISWPEATVG
jgi:hypothetical protein